ncbi:MAG: hypothetical protein JWN86_395 [Planctomycetota bacterium]|nr:hypothetical protein [Planctomycetota bacterium]
MPADSAPEINQAPAVALLIKDLALVWAFYIACALILSYPLIKTFSTTLAGSLIDPLQHLWIMRWYRSCLLEWRSPVICPELQYPVGAPLGNFSPLHLQAILFIPLSLVLRNDVLCFNLVWLFAMTTTGLGTFLLAWQAVRDKPCAAFAGMLAMLSTPMMLHCRSHLELITLGGFPLFLVGWMRFVDRPTRGRLVVSAGLYVLVALCAAYYVVFAMVPAALYVVWKLMNEGRNGPRWLVSRMFWLTGFGVLALPALALVFGNHIWASANGYASQRSLTEFNAYSAAPWTFIIPTPMHRIDQFMPANVYAAAGYSLGMGERSSYLGVITILLIHQAAVRKEKFARRGYLWLALVAMVVLAWGGVLKLGDRKIVLPAGWLRDHFFAFRMLRVPARFNLFVGVVAAVIAAAGLKGILARISQRPVRVVLYGSVVALSMVDLLIFPFSTGKIPEMPACYRTILDRDPQASFVEVPQYPSSGSFLYSLTSYWQSIHRGRTNAGYSGNGNTPMDNLVSWNSPFSYFFLEDPNYLADPEWTSIDVVGGVSFHDYTWLYLHQNKYRYVVLHQWKGYADGYPEKLSRVKALMSHAKIFEDARTIVYDRAKLTPPTRPVVVSAEGWRESYLARRIRAVGKTSSLAVYNPNASRPVSLALNASAFRSSRTARLLLEGRELASWTIVPDREFRTYRTPPLMLPAGVSLLTLDCDGEETPWNSHEFALETDSAPYSLKVAGLTISSESVPSDPPTRQIAAQPKPNRLR